MIDKDKCIILQLSHQNLPIAKDSLFKYRKRGDIKKVVLDKM